MCVVSSRTATAFSVLCLVQSVFLDYIAGMLAHRSSLTGVPLRQDPVIAGWQLAEGATHPGIPSSEPLLVSSRHSLWQASCHWMVVQVG